MRPAVKYFAETMEKRLMENEHKGGWKDCKPEFLLSELRKNLAYLEENLNKGETKEDVCRRAANIANFAMMIANNWGGICSNNISGKER